MKNVNHYYFNNIDSEEKAYWLGYLAADGCVKSCNEISLSSIDLEHINKFKLSIQSDHKIGCILTINKPIYRIFFRSKQMIADIIKYSILPRKTYFPFGLPNISNYLLKHYIRGYLDGDGHITSDLRNHCKRWYIGCCSNSFTLLSEIVDYFNLTINISKISIRRSINKLGSSFCFRYGGNLCVAKICEHIYKNATIYLDRKYKLAIAIISQKDTNISNKVSKFIGVQKRNDHYQAKIMYSNKSIYLGSFDDEIKAAKAYDNAAIKYNRKNLNFPLQNST